MRREVNPKSPDGDSSFSKHCIAFVHDNFVQNGGAERVAEVIAKALPKAEVFTTAVLRDKLSPYLQTRNIRGTILGRAPGLRKYYRHYFLLFAWAARQIPLKGHDLVVTSCCGFAKWVRKPKGAIHICYCHTPTRWIWRFSDYAAREGFSFLLRAVLSVLVRGLRFFDLRAGKNGPDFYIANSSNVANRIRQYYGRDSIVLHPPIDCSRFTLSHESGDYYLIVSRLVAYKRIDLAIAACEMAGRRLVIIGDGPDRTRLESLKGPNTILAGRLSDREVEENLKGCRALLFPGEEDFGMTPLEANATGKPCVAFGSGGALESVIDGETGILFPEPTPESLIEALVKVERIAWNPERMRKHAMCFDISVFTDRFLETVASMLASHHASGRDSATHRSENALELESYGL